MKTEGQGNLPKGTASGGQAQGISDPSLLPAPFPTAITLILFSARCPGSQGPGPPRCPSLVCLHRAQGGGFHRAHWNPQSKSSAEVQVVPGTSCRHPEPGRVRKSRVPWGHRANKDTCPGDKQGDMHAPVPALGRAPCREAAWPHREPETSKALQ